MANRFNTRNPGVRRPKICNAPPKPLAPIDLGITACGCTNLPIDVFVYVDDVFNWALSAANQPLENPTWKDFQNHLFRCRADGTNWELFAFAMVGWMPNDLPKTCSDLLYSRFEVGSLFEVYDAPQ